MNAMPPGRILAALVIAAAAASAGAETNDITDSASAVRAAKHYTKGQCTAESPCTYKALREGKQWRVRVQLSKRKSAREVAQANPGGSIILYFDTGGNLIRRLDAD
jgi:hypothetical protein